jgi:hypothetical protein
MARYDETIYSEYRGNKTMSTLMSGRFQTQRAGVVLAGLLYINDLHLTTDYDRFLSSAE